jgi:uncharacterized protein YcaQ
VQLDGVSVVEARRIALRAQGFGAARPASPNLGHVRRVLDRLGALQIDAVNVLVRSHELPLFARLGAYDRALFDRLFVERRLAVDTIAHAASFVPVELYPLLRWRMAANAAHPRWIASRHAVEERLPGYVGRVLAEIAERGPLTFGELADPARGPRRTEATANPGDIWWNPRPSTGKHVLEGLWRAGEVAVAERRAGFERAYDLPERVIPAGVREAPVPEPTDAWRELVRRSVRTLGVGWARDIADVFRLPVAVTKARLRELVDAGEVTPVAVEGSTELAYLDPAARARPVSARALLSPFDSLLWERTRNVRLLGFRHSFEIYVPAAQRTYGYYVLPFLLDEAIVARVDLKADRAGHALLVRAAHHEDGVSPAAVAGALADELHAMAGWLGLDRVVVDDVGDLAPELRRSVSTQAR